MMPQKKNPDALELIRGKAAGAIGNLTGMLTLLKGLPLAYNRDLQDDKRLAFPAVAMVKEALSVAAGIAATARLREERIGERIDEGFLDATSLPSTWCGRASPSAEPPDRGRPRREGRATA
jgi:argininosuccinate lyase